MNRPPPPPGLVAAAEQDHAAMRHALADLLPTVRALLDDKPTEVEVLTDVWLTLLWHPRRAAALLGAAAILQLAQQSAPQPARPGTQTSRKEPS